MSAKESPSPCVSFFRKQDSNCLRCSLRSSALFAELSPVVAEWATRNVENGIFRRDCVIYRAGHSGDAIFTVRVGVVKLVLDIPGRETRIVRLLGRGATLGLERLAGCPYAHTAVPLRTTNLCRIPLSVVHELHAQNPRLMRGLMVKWNEHITWVDRWIALLGSGAIERRLVDLVQLLIDISGDPLDAVGLPAASDVAAILGVAPESVNRHMAELKRKGLLKRVAPRTYWCDPSLFALANVEPEENIESNGDLLSAGEVLKFSARPTAPLGPIDIQPDGTGARIDDGDGG